jgi:hypothetical protein
MPELKASKLLASDRGRKLVAALLAGVDGRYVVTVSDKLLALCGWLFEYIYEPVYQDRPRLLYEKNLHQFVAMYTWLWMTDPNSGARRAIEEFQKYMGSRNLADPHSYSTIRDRYYPKMEPSIHSNPCCVSRMGTAISSSPITPVLTPYPPTAVDGLSTFLRPAFGAVSTAGAEQESFFPFDATQASRSKRSLPTHRRRQ